MEKGDRAVVIWEESIATWFKNVSDRSMFIYLGKIIIFDTGVGDDIWRKFFKARLENFSQKLFSFI